MKKIIFLFMLATAVMVYADCTRSSKKCKDNRKKISKLRKSGAIKM